MDSRRLVVWISTGILGFQGATLAFDLLNCTALSWLYVRTNGLAALERRVDEPAGRAGVVDPDAPQQPAGASTPGHPVVLFCTRPQGQGCLKVCPYRPWQGFRPQVWSEDSSPLHGRISFQRRRAGRTG